MKKELRLFYCDFWPTWSQENNFFSDLLKNNYELIIDPNTPQLLIHCRYGSIHKGYNPNTTCKIYWTADPTGWLTKDKGSTSGDYGVYDYQARPGNPVLWNHYSITNDLDNNHVNHYFFPFYLFYSWMWYNDLLKSHINPPDWTTKKDISFVYSNPKPAHRNNYFNVLSQHFKINSGGKHLNNINNMNIDKVSFLRDHAYDLSIENCFEYGYSTEKIIEPIVAQTIPIYWGYTPKHINPARYIQAPSDPEDLIRHIHHLNNNPHLAQNILKQPAFTNPRAIVEEIDNLRLFLYNIIENIL